MASEKNPKLHMKRNDSGNRSGMVTVEVVISFTVFLVVVFGVIYFTNIFIVHNKIQFAINSAAHEIAAYTYLYQALGARDAEKTMNKDLGKYADNVDDTVTQVTDTMNKISGLYDSGKSLVDDASTVTLDTEYIAKIEADAAKVEEAGGNAYGSGKESAAKIQGLFEDPSGTVVGIIYMAVDGASYYVKSLGARLAAEAMVKKYLKQGDMSADHFLKGMGVKDGYNGLDFSGSTMFCDDDYRMIDIVVEYDIHVGFLGLIMSDPNIHVIQRASVSAWVGDNGERKHSAYLKGKNVGDEDKKAEEKKKEEDPRGAELKEANFPDPKILTLAKSYDTDKDGFLSKEEASKLKRIAMSRTQITSLKGIEYFNGLTYLSIFDVPAVGEPGKLDLSNLKDLKWIDIPCSGATEIIFAEESPIGKMLQQENVSHYDYNYWGNGAPCIKFYGSDADALVDRYSIIRAGDFVYDGTARLKN